MGGGGELSDLLFFLFYFILYNFINLLIITITSGVDETVHPSGDCE